MNYVKLATSSDYRITVLDSGDNRSYTFKTSEITLTNALLGKIALGEKTVRADQKTIAKVNRLWLDYANENHENVQIVAAAYDLGDFYSKTVFCRIG